MLRWHDTPREPPRTLADDWLAQRRRPKCSTCVHRVRDPKDPGAMCCALNEPFFPFGPCGLWRVAVTEVMP